MPFHLFIHFLLWWFSLGIIPRLFGYILSWLGPVFYCSHFYWSKAFPLFGHNYDSVLEAIDKMEKDLPGFFYAGNCKNIKFFFLARAIIFCLQLPEGLKEPAKSLIIFD